MAVLSLWMEHDARDWVLLALYCHHKFFSVYSVCGKNVEEVGKRFSLRVSVCLDHPVVGMIKDMVSPHFFNQILRELVEHIGPLLHLAVFLREVHGSRLVVDYDIGESLFVVFIGKVLDKFKALTDAKDWEVNPFLIFLSQHVLPHFLTELVEVRHFTCLTIY